jgi:uncharacterized membrane protein
MAKIDRDDIYHITTHSNLSSDKINGLLSQYVYNNSAAWKKFLRLFFIMLATGFLSAGVIMFFAYNWAALGKFSKIGLIELLVILTVCFVLFSKLKEDIKNILLTGASILVGVLFAVFGQIYQTGADAYDFFLGWTISVTLWVLVSNYAPLWLIYLGLVQTTFILYAAQVAVDWSPVFVSGILFVINLIAAVGFHWTAGMRPTLKIRPWFLKTLAIAAVACATTGLTTGIFDDAGLPFSMLLILTAAAYAWGIHYGLRQKRAFYISITSLSIVAIISAFMMKVGSDAGMFLLTFVFIVVSITFIIRKLIWLQKKWAGE